MVLAAPKARCKTLRKTLQGCYVPSRNSRSGRPEARLNGPYAPGRPDRHPTRKPGPPPHRGGKRQVKSGSGWKTLDKGVKTVPPGGGSNKRAVANWKCTNLIAKNHFRTVVDADIVGYPDSPEKLVTKTQTLYCGI
ncbi:hypothetical protein [Streptomyces sioyaensis]|uniref:hypothetical protein n=1 Tax=Streptomyces sioyaensis TaxID=67364 RepID=UPI0037B3CD4A